MNNKRLWMVASMLIVLPLLAGCGTANKDNELLVGTWHINNIESMFGDEDLDIADIEEYVEFDLALIFGANGEFSFSLSLLMDFEAMMADLMGDLGVEIEADNIDIQVLLVGTYEIDSPGVLLLSFDRDEVTFTPEEYCFTVAGFESCENIQDFIGSMDEDFFVLEDEGAFYEVDESSLTIWDSSCDYPEDQSCAAQFTR